MTRRCHGWDYGRRGIYMLTLVLEERGRPRLAGGPVSGPSQDLGVGNRGGEGRSCAAPETGALEKARWICPPTAAGWHVLECWRRIPEFWPQVELFCSQTMPDHFHGLLFVRERLPAGKTLGDVVRGFKTGCREVGWAEGFVDTILFNRGQLPRMKAYVLANPERLGIKRAHPDLFRTVHGVEAGALRFQALGNRALLDWPIARAVQCSRADFVYRRAHLPGGGRTVLRGPDGITLVERTTQGFEAACAAALEAAERGAVLVSPCLSDGEREIARRAFAEGSRVVVLRNKGFAPGEKPHGALFRMCAEGRLLLLAPAGWPWVPAQKPLKREEALALNRMAQMLAGGAASSPIPYRGAVCRDVDTLVRQACAPA